MAVRCAHDGAGDEGILEWQRVKCLGSAREQAAYVLWVPSRFLAFELDSPSSARCERAVSCGALVADTSRVFIEGHIEHRDKADDVGVRERNPQPSDKPYD
jgi:hypothetical protein